MSYYVFTFPNNYSSSPHQSWRVYGLGVSGLRSCAWRMVSVWKLFWRVHFWWFLWARLCPHLQLYKYTVTQVFAWVTPLQHLKELFIEINQMIITLMTARLHVVPCIHKNDTSVHQNMATMGSESTKQLCIKGLTPTCIVLVTWGFNPKC